MKREEMMARLDAREEPWDVVIVGGGICGWATAYYLKKFREESQQEVGRIFLKTLIYI